MEKECPCINKFSLKAELLIDAFESVIPLKQMVGMSDPIAQSVASPIADRGAVS